MIKDFNRIFFWVAVVFLGGSSLLFPIVSYIAIVVMVSGLISDRFSLIKRLFFSWAIILASNICIYTIGSLVGTKIPFDFLGYFYSVLALVLLVRCKKVFSFKNIFDRDDVPGLIAALTTFSLLMLPFAATAKLGPSDFVRMLSSGEDNASHYAIINYNSTNEQFSYLSNRDSAGLIQSLSIYQQGLHMNEAIIANFTKTGQLSDFTLLRLFYIFSALFYALLSYWLVVIGLSVARRLRPKISNLSWIAVLPVVIFFVSFNSSLNLFSWGFQTQIASYVFLLSLTWLCFNAKREFLTALLICIQIILISNTWYLLLPVAGIIAFVALYYTLKDLFKRKSARFLMLYVASFLLSIFPIVVGSLFSQKSNPLNEQGGVHILSNAAILASVFLSIALLLVLRKDKIIRQSVLVGIIMSLLMLLFISVYQLATIGKLEYYFYKSLYTLSLFALVSGVALFVVGVDIVKSLLKRYGPIFASVVFVVNLGFIYNLKPVQARVTINNWYNHAMEPSDAEAAFAVKAKDKNQDLIYLGDCNRASDYLSNRWAGAILLSESFSRNQFETHYLLDTPEKQREYLRAHISNRSNITAKIDHKCIDLEVMDILKSKNTTVL